MSRRFALFIVIFAASIAITTALSPVDIEKLVNDFKENRETNQPVYPLNTEKKAIDAVRDIQRQLYLEFGDACLPLNTKNAMQIIAFVISRESTLPDIGVDDVTDKLIEFLLVYYKGTTGWCKAVEKTVRLIHPMFRLSSKFLATDNIISNKELLREVCMDALINDGFPHGFIPLYEEDQCISKTKAQSKYLQALDLKREF